MRKLLYAGKVLAAVLVIGVVFTRGILWSKPRHELYWNIPLKDLRARYPAAGPRVVAIDRKPTGFAWLIDSYSSHPVRLRNDMRLEWYDYDLGIWNFVPEDSINHDPEGMSERLRALQTEAVRQRF